MSDTHQNSQNRNSEDEQSNFTISSHESILDDNIMHRIAELSSDDDSDDEKITMANIAKEILLPKTEAYILPNLTQSHFELELNGRKMYQRSKSIMPLSLTKYYSIIFKLYFLLVNVFKTRFGFGFLYTSYRCLTYLFALGIHVAERTSISWALFITYIHRFIITLDEWVTWVYDDRHHYDPINGKIMAKKTSFID